MNDQRGEQPDRQLQLLQELIEEHATIAGDVIEVGTGTWAIHGSIAVDGEVLIAEYDTPRQGTDGPGQALPADLGTAEPLRKRRGHDRCPTRRRSSGARQGWVRAREE